MFITLGQVRLGFIGYEEAVRVPQVKPPLWLGIEKNNLPLPPFFNKFREYEEEGSVFNRHFEGKYHLL